MKISCIQENLARGLNIVARSVGTRTTLPVLNNILLKTEKGGLKLSATDLEMGIYTWIGAKIEAEGAITVPAKILLEYISSNHDQKIDLKLDNLTLQLKSEHYKANIKGIEATEFPLIPKVQRDVEIEISTEEFKKAVTRTIIATAIDESRPVLSGIYFLIKGNSLKIVATDSYRLAEYTIKLEKKPAREIAFIVPQRTMAEVLRIVEEAPEKIQIYPGENQVEFVLGKTILVSRLIEGAFPDYTQIVPKSFKTQFTANQKEFTDAIKMAVIFAKESANNVKIKLDPQVKTTITSISPQIGDNTSEVSGKVTGAKVEIAFNAKFILDALSIINTENITLELVDNMAPGVLRDDKDPNYFYIIMPLRIEE